MSATEAAGERIVELEADLAEAKRLLREAVNTLSDLRLGQHDPEVCICQEKARDVEQAARAFLASEPGERVGR